MPHETVYLHAEDIVDDEDMQIQNDRPVRILKSSINGKDEAVINRLEEPYPTECYNHGQMAKQTQKYYMCKKIQMNQSSGKPKEAFRVTKETYQFLLANHSDSYSCFTQNVDTNVCVCPKGQSDFECVTASSTKCYLNITNPPFYQGCEDRPDTPYYLYSVPGYSPCYP